MHRPNLAAVKRFLRQPPARSRCRWRSRRPVELELVRVDITTADFKVVTSDSNGQAVPYEPGVHYRGKIKGDPDSHAAVSVFRDEVMGSYFTPAEGTVVIGRLLGDNPGAKHIVYPSRVIDAHNDWTCETKDHGNGSNGKLRGADFDLGSAAPAAPAGLDFLAASGGPGAGTGKAFDDKALVKCVRVYVEAAYDVYQNKGSASAVTSYVTGFFNQSAVLYANESIPISLSQVYVWTSNDPYSDTGSSSTMLSGFQSYRNSFNGAVGHLVAFHGGGGSRRVQRLLQRQHRQPPVLQRCQHHLLQRAYLLVDGAGVHPRDGSPLRLPPHPRLRVERQQHRHRRLLHARGDLLAARPAVRRRHHHELLPPVG